MAPDRHRRRAHVGERRRRGDGGRRRRYRRDHRRRVRRPYWGFAFAVGGGLAAGTIALVSQRFGADEDGGIGLAVRTSAAVVVAATLPVTAAFWAFAPDLIALLGDTPDAVGYDGVYLRIVGLGVPFAALNLVGSRVLVDSDDAYTAMPLRAGGAAVNVAANAALVFGLDTGVAGAAVGTVVSNAVVTAAFAAGSTRGGLPLVGAFPVRVDPFGRTLDADTARDLVSIGLPVFGRNLVRTVAEFPMLAILAMPGPDVVAAFVIARRVWGS